MPVRIFQAAAALLGAMCFASTGARAAETTVMTVGNPNGASVVFAFDKASKPGKIILRTRRAGVTGSKLSVYVDQAKTAAFSHIFTSDECSYPEGGSSECATVVSEKDSNYAAIVRIFKLGKLARITAEDAGTMSMDHLAPLVGFTKSFDG